MIEKITYEDKVAIQNDTDVADINKVTDTDMNEIKQVVNNNADDFMVLKDNLTNNQLTGTAEGDNIYIDDAYSSGTAKMTLLGKSEQDGTPTPDTPIEIQNIEGDVEVGFVGKNLYDINRIEKGRLDNGALGYASGTTDLQINNGTVTCATSDGFRGFVSDFIKVTDIEYYLSFDIVDYRLSIRVAGYDKNKNWLNDINSYNISSTDKKIVRFAPSNEIEYVRISIMINSSGSFVFENLQLEPYKATAYEPYQSQTANFTFTEGQKLMEGGYLASDGVHNVRKQIVLDGTEDWRTSSSQLGENTSYFVFTTTDMKRSSKMVCDKFINRSTWNTDVEAINCTSNDDNLRLRINTSRASTVAELKTWLSENRPIVEYELIEEEVTPYTADQQKQWDKLQSLQLFDEVNNISSPATMQLTYVKSTASVINNLQDQINELKQAIVSIGGV